jgi:hypothetical protein
MLFYSPDVRLYCIFLASVVLCVIDMQLLCIVSWLVAAAAAAAMIKAR